MPKWVYFHSNKEGNRERGLVSVQHAMRGTVCVSISTSGLGGFRMESELTPEEAREMSAGLLELADIAEKESKNG